MGFAQYGLDTLIFGGEFKLKDALLSTVMGVGSGLISGAGAQNIKGLAKAINPKMAISSIMVSKIRTFTHNGAFSNIVTQEFVQATIKINIMTVLNTGLTEIKRLWVVD